MYLFEWLIDSIVNNLLNLVKKMKRELPSKIERQLETVRKQAGDSITIGKNVLNRNFL